MGEIATWSAVKTKVGLGKDSNECPTKAELLALSPTGTGESYVGLEISNASSYGDNETVQLSDIHKVTYSYAFSASRNLLTYSALGGTSTSGASGSQFSIYSAKYKKWDGNTVEELQVSKSVVQWYPSWITLDSGLYKANENTETTERVGYMKYRQDESNKEITITFQQAAGVETWEYNFSVVNSNLDFTALGGVSITGDGYLNILSNKQRYVNGKVSGSPLTVTYSSNDFPDWLSYQTEPNDSVKAIATENKSESSRSFTRTITQAESGKKLTVTYTQAAGVKTYGDITITPTSEITDIPAAGGTSGIFTYSYSQPWGWNGKTNDGGTITSGATASWSNAVSGSNLGTTAKARTKLGTRTLTLTQNGKTGTASKDVYQAANQIESTTQGEWVVSISANPSTFTEQGGTSQISASARASRTNHWTSGATNAASDATGTPTLSIPTAVTGFSLSGTTLTVAENTTPNDRSVVVRATMGSVYKEVTVTQSAYLVEWKYYLTTSTPTLNFDAIGATKSGTISSYREKYINGSLVEGSHEGVNIQVKSMSAEIQSATAAIAITMKENTTTQARTGTVVYEQVGSGKTVTITCSQAAGTVTTREVLGWISGIPDSAPSAGGSVSGTIQSGYWDVVNGKDTTFHPVAPEVTSKSSYITSVNFTKRDTQYTITITFSANNSESSRQGRVELAYGSKTLGFNVSQNGGTVTWDYTFAIYSPGTKILNMAAKPTSSGVIEVTSYRTKVINGTPTSTTELVDVTVDSIDENWVEVVKGTTTGTRVNFNVTLLENTVNSTRSMTVTLRQVGTSNLDQVDINQAAGTVTTRDVIDYIEPIPSGNIGPLEQILEVTVESYRETLINGTVSNKVAVTPTVDLNFEGSETGWATINIVKPDSPEYQYIIQIEVVENTTNNTRSANIMPKNGSAEPENAFGFTQDAATIETSYDIYWALSDRGNDLIFRATSYSLDSGGEADRIHLFLLCDKITTINGNETSRTIVNTGPSELTNYGPVYTDANGEPSSLIRDDGGQNLTPALFPELKDRPNTYNVVIGSGPNEGLYQETITMTYNKDVMDGSTPVGKVPAFYWVVDPIPYQRVFEFSWKQEGSLISNVVLNGDIMNSDSVASRDIISYESLRRNGVEFSRRYIKPTLIPPSEDWVQVIDNGQNSDNSYNYAIRALTVTDNESDSARSTSARFEQPGNGNQALSLYISQDPKSVIREELHAELGNYYSYGASDIIPLIYQWYSPDSSDTSSTGDTTPGGYSGVWCNLPATGVINCMITGKPTTGKPMKARLNNIQVRTIDENAYPEVETNQGLSVGYSQQDYKLGIEYSPGMNTYFLITPEILSESGEYGGEYGGGIRVEVALRTSYSQNGTTIATITLTPKNPDHPTIYFELIYG